MSKPFQDQLVFEHKPEQIQVRLNELRQHNYVGDAVLGALTAVGRGRHVDGMKRGCSVATQHPAELSR